MKTYWGHRRRAPRIEDLRHYMVASDRRRVNPRAEKRNKSLTARIAYPGLCPLCSVYWRGLVPKGRMDAPCVMSGASHSAEVRFKGCAVQSAASFFRRWSRPTTPCSLFSNVTMPNLKYFQLCSWYSGFQLPSAYDSALLYLRKTVLIGLCVCVLACVP